MQTCHIPCFAHIINLAVQKFIGQIYDNTLGVDVEATLTKVRELAKGIRKSTLRWELFQKACKELSMNPSTIPLDIKVRWNSVLRMLEAAIYLRKPITRFLFNLINDEPNEANTKFYDRCQMSEAEWELIEVLYVFLLPFKRVTTRFENKKGNPEIDYTFFAYDRMFNHIEDVLFSLRSPHALGSLDCAPVFKVALEGMKSKLAEYYDKTHLPFVDADAMILNPRCKLSIFEEKTWSDTAPEQYSESCRRRFELDYMSDVTIATSSSHGLKRSAPDDDDDEELRAILAQRSSNRRMHSDYERYSSVPNDPTIKSALGWWKANHALFPDLAKMAREEEEDYPVSEVVGNIPAEWEQDWWKRKLRREVRSEIMDRFIEDDE